MFAGWNVTNRIIVLKENITQNEIGIYKYKAVAFSTCVEDNVYTVR